MHVNTGVAATHAKVAQGREEERKRRTRGPGPVVEKDGSSFLILLSENSNLLETYFFFSLPN